MNLLAHAALNGLMTLEYEILQRLRFGPVWLNALEDIDDDGLDGALSLMAMRRQVCMRNQQISLFWHRHMIGARDAA